MAVETSKLGIVAAVSPLSAMDLYATRSCVSPANREGRCLDSFVLRSGPLRYDDLSARFRVDPSSPPTDTEYATCPFHLTDLGFFAKVNAPDGRVTAQWHQPDRWRAAEVSGNDSAQCPLSQTAVPCPPKVNPDKCGIDASYIRAVESSWLFRLEREESWVTWETDKERSDYVDRIWSARGTPFPKVRTSLRRRLQVPVVLSEEPTVKLLVISESLCSPVAHMNHKRLSLVRLLPRQGCLSHIVS